MKHLLSINDLSREEAIAILDTASQLETLTQGNMKKLPTLRGYTVVNLFFEDSTRPSYFPFTEPSAEIDMAFGGGKLAGRWLEISGAFG